MQASIIIRVKNERENLIKLFEILKKQTYQDFEILLVDNESTDGSEKIAFDYFSSDRIQVIKIKDFSYSKACNLGAQTARGKYLIYLSAHSFPISKTWLADGLVHFQDEQVAGVSAYPHPGKEGTMWERLFFEPPHLLLKLGLRSFNLGNTNSIIRKSFWEKHHFNESLIRSEDLEWSMYWKNKGFKIVSEPKFSVYHSHRLDPLGILRAEIGWKRENLKIRNSLDTKF